MASAGFGVAEMLSDEKVEIVVSGKFGTNMVNALKSKGMRYRELSGMTVREALKSIN